MKVFAIALIFLGEVLSIATEMFGARYFETQSFSFWTVFLKLIPFIILGSSLLLAGYIVGYGLFKNIWIVSAISITSIVLIEPILAWLVFEQVPTTGALIGFVLGAIGLVVALLF